MEMALRIGELSEQVPGNVMVFLPSYTYMSAVLRTCGGWPSASCCCPRAADEQGRPDGLATCWAEDGRS